MDDKQALRAQELQRFSQNASRLLVDKDRLPALLAELNYLAERKGENELRGPCPVCRRSYCHIGMNGRVHTIYWKCFDRTCPSNTGKAKVHHNLLGLVRALVEDGKLGTSIKTIAKFLGFEQRSFDITNGKIGCQVEAVAAPDGEDGGDEDLWTYPPK